MSDLTNNRAGQKTTPQLPDQQKVTPADKPATSQASKGIAAPHLSSRPIYVAAASALLITLITLVILPNASRPLATAPTFLAIYAVTTALVEALTAYFLAIQFRFTKSAHLAALSGAFGYIAVLVFCQMLVFPGVFSATIPFAAGPQGSIWLWSEWHLGFALLVSLALLIRAREAGSQFPHKWRRAAWMLIFAGPFAAGLLALGTILGGSHLPVLINSNAYGAFCQSYIPAGSIALTLLALVMNIKITRLNDPLSLWLSVVLIAGLSDMILTLADPFRYGLGWYAGRCLSLVSVSLVFCVFLFEFSRLHNRLGAANAALSTRAFTDSLTGAFNRGYFDEQFPRELRRAQRDRLPLSLLIIDVDHFKSYNDYYGHPKGDTCLAAMVTVMQNVIKRPADFIARYGGEEFVAVLPNTGASGAAQVANQLRDGVTVLGMPRSNATAAHVTISIGIATYHPNDQPFGVDELLRQADYALYQAKQQGRDCVRSFPPGEMAGQSAMTLL